MLRYITVENGILKTRYLFLFVFYFRPSIVIHIYPSHIFFQHFLCQFLIPQMLHHLLHRNILLQQDFFLATDQFFQFLSTSFQTFSFFLQLLLFTQKLFPAHLPFMVLLIVRFSSFSELNAETSIITDKLNNREFSKEKGNRKKLFDKYD